jgi:hypothetical protein
VPNPYLTAQGQTHNFYVEILNTYVNQTATFTVAVTVSQNFNVANPTQTGSLDPAAYKELVFPLTASATVPVAVYANAIQVSLDYTIGGANYHDELTPPATIEVRTVRATDWLATLQQWEQQKAANLTAWKQEMVTQLSPSLQVSATPTLTEVGAGDSFDVTVAVKNVGTGPAESVELTLTPTAAFSLRTAAVMTIESIDVGASTTITYGLTTMSDAQAGSYSPAVGYTYVNALDKGLGLSASATTGTATFSVTVKAVQKSFIEQNMLLIIIGIVAVVIIVIVVALVARRKK